MTEAHHPSLDTGLIESLTDLERAREIAAGCVRCPLKETRTLVVFGEGNPGASLMLVGEGPGEEEDARGRPFVGRAGQLLYSALAEAGIPRRRQYRARARPLSTSSCHTCSTVSPGIRSATSNWEAGSPSGNASRTRATAPSP